MEIEEEEDATPSSSASNKELIASFASFDEALNNLQNLFDESEFFKKSLKDVQSKFSELDNAKFNIALAYSVYTLFFLYLKTQGIPTQGHPVMAELERVKGYIQKLKDITEGPAVPQTRINPDASKRVISAALFDAETYNKKRAEGQQQQQQEMQKQHSEASKRVISAALFDAETYNKKRAEGQQQQEKQQQHQHQQQEEEKEEGEEEEEQEEKQPVEPKKKENASKNKYKSKNNKPQQREEEAAAASSKKRKKKGYQQQQQQQQKRPYNTKNK